MPNQLVTCVYLCYWGKSLQMSRKGLHCRNGGAGIVALGKHVKSWPLAHRVACIWHATTAEKFKQVTAYSFSVTARLKYQTKFLPVATPL